MRLAILQRVCPPYRIGLFKALSSSADVQCRLFIGENIPNTKVRSAVDLEGLDVERLRTRFFKVGRRVLPWHLGLVDSLKNYRPDVVLCEGESHFLGYLQALYYRARHNRTAALMHWCFTSLPGEPNQRRDLPTLLKALFRPHFDAFVCYSSFSKERLEELGQPAAKIFVATNVGQVHKYLAVSDELCETKETARDKLGLPQRFTVLYAGTLDENKRPDIVLDMANICESQLYNFVLVGAGGQLERLRSRVANERLSNVSLPGSVGDELARYYRAADVLVVPGRGGIVISEALATGLPVVVHQADGTEYDLVDHGVTGLRLDRGSAQDFAAAVDFLRWRPATVASMGQTGKQRIAERYNETTMASQILKASQYAMVARASVRGP